MQNRKVYNLGMSVAYCIVASILNIIAFTWWSFTTDIGKFIIGFIIGFSFIMLKMYGF